MIGWRFLPLVGLLTGCGTAAGEDPCATHAATACALRDACTNGLGVLVQYGDRATCASREAEACRRDVGAPDTGVSDAIIERCTAALTLQECSTFFDARPVAECAAPGGRAAGRACVSDWQCAGGFCEVAPGAACGTCTGVPGDGDDCVNPGVVAFGLACSKVTHTWVPLGAAGAACDAAVPCGAGFTCVGADPQQAFPGACQAAATVVGAGCDPDRQVAADCDRNQGLTCAAAGTCTPISLAAPWDACGRLLDDSVAMCTAGSACVFPAGSRQGTCVQAVAEGTPCDRDNGPPCLAPARCMSAAGGTSGTCQFLDAEACP